MERIIMGGWVNFKTLKNSNVKIGGDRSELIGFFLPLTLLLLVHPSTVFFGICALSFFSISVTLLAVIRGLVSSSSSDRWKMV